MADYLTKDSIQRIRNGENNSNNFYPVLQVVSIVSMRSGENLTAAAARYRVFLTDGVEQIQSMPATQLNQAIMEGKVVPFSVIRLTNFQMSNVGNHAIVVLLEFQMVAQLNQEIILKDAAIAQTLQPPPHNYGTSNPYSAAPSTAGSSIYHPTYGTNSATPTPNVNPNSVHYGAAAPPPLVAPNSYGSAPSYGVAQLAPAPAAPAYATQKVQNAPFQANSPYGSFNPTATGNKPVVKDDSNITIVPISAINPYSSKWTIKARITAKSDIRKWSNARGEGTLFSVDLLDNQGGEIRGTFFKDACDRFFPVLQEGKVYTFSGGTLKVVQNRQYSSLKNNYEITFNVNSEIVPVHDDAGIKSQVFNFVKIGAIATIDTNATIDVIAVVRAATDVSEIVSNKQGGRTLLKRDLTLVDDSSSEIKLTLWGEKAQSPLDWASNPVIAFKNVKVGDYGGKSLSSMTSTSITVNPEIPEGLHLHNWRKSYGQAIPSGLSLSSGASLGGGLDPFDKRKVISAIKDEGLGLNGDKPDYITIKGTVIYIKHDNEPFYTACPTPGCNKKVSETMGAEFLCEKCNKTFPNCVRRYILSVNLADHSGSNWFTLFNDTADVLLKAKAEDLHEMKVKGDEAGYEKTFTDALFQTIVGKVRVKQEQVNEEARVKSSFVKVEKLDVIGECKNLLDAISKYQ